MKANDLEPVEITEAFHLAYLTMLSTQAKANTFALKGGGNLRFFFDSLRYSEDIDLDVFSDNPRMFSERIERAFASAGLTKLLGAVGLKVNYLNPKDRTMTKEKWIIGLDHRTGSSRVFTKVEFSYRSYGLEEYVVVESIPDRIVAPYAPIPAPLIGHYLPRAAVIQKVTALRDRRHTQPRDVFDLDHIFRKYPSAGAIGIVTRGDLDDAIGRIYDLDFPTYRTKVVTFLEPSIRSVLDTPEAWGQMQIRVIEHLEAMR